jgi:hypothetical protein
MRRGLRCALGALALVLGIAGAPADALAMGLPIEVELGPQRTGPFGTLELADVGGGVEFTILLNTSVLGSQANLHEFYFNLPDSFDFDEDDIAATLDCNVSDCELEFDEGRSVRGGAGADFGFSLNFDAGNERIHSVSFVLPGLTAQDVLDAALASPGVTGRGLEVLFAAHVQGSGAGHGSASATIGVPVPEPGATALLAVGLAGLGFAGRRRVPRA